MKYNFQIKKGRLAELGVHMYSDGLSIVSDIRGKNNCGIIIYTDSPKKQFKISFLKEHMIGGLYCIFIPDFPFDEFKYTFFCDDVEVGDSYALLTDASSKFAYATDIHHVDKCIFATDSYDWEEDIMPEIPYHEAIIYKLHMRGFTKHTSSAVQHKGTFSGVKEKIPYLKELGITTVQSMPIFDFKDVIYNPSYSKIDESLLPYLGENESVWKSKPNYWGYADGNYFAPKRSYSSSDRPDVELKDLVKELHKNGMELILEFYFPTTVLQGFILDVCRYWVKAYHIDGFKLMGCNIPVQLLISDPYLQHTKLIFESLDGVKLPPVRDCKNVAVMSTGFLYDVRKYLKGDEDMLRAVTTHFRENPVDCAIVNEITSYQGFTLADLVSYDRKHNELNGEENRDGSDYNYSWNCGAEGKTRKKAILNLREQQSKNALFMLLTSQGTPVLLAGDEFGNSADGNNNPYCQDNAVSWLNWKKSSRGNELLSFTKNIIAFRKAHPILHKEDALRQSDYISAGYPDLSYHSEQAWYAGFENYNRHIGIMYCGKYAKIDRKHDDNFIYAAYNTHWIDHDFALPKLPEEMQWEIVIPTCVMDKLQIGESNDQKGNHILVPPRSMVLLMGVQKPKEQTDESITTLQNSMQS